MRVKVTILIRFLNVGIVSLIATIGAHAEEKKQSAKKTTEEIEKLVNDLGDKDFRIRDQASKHLSQIPRALIALRRFSQDKDLERRKRAAALVEDLTQKNFRRLFDDTVSQKHNVKIDLLIELVTQNDSRMDH